MFNPTYVEMITSLVKKMGFNIIKKQASSLQANTPTNESVAYLRIVGVLFRPDRYQEQSYSAFQIRTVGLTQHAEGESISDPDLFVAWTREEGFDLKSAKPHMLPPENFLKNKCRKLMLLKMRGQYELRTGTPSDYRKYASFVKGWLPYEADSLGPEMLSSIIYPMIVQGFLATSLEGMIHPSFVFYSPDFAKNIGLLNVFKDVANSMLELEKVGIKTSPISNHKDYERLTWILKEQAHVLESVRHIKTSRYYMYPEDEHSLAYHLISYIQNLDLSEPIALWTLSYIGALVPGDLEAAGIFGNIWSDRNLAISRLQKYL